MKKSTFISLLALVTALVGVAIAAAAFFCRRKDLMYDDYEEEDTTLYDDDVDYFSAKLDESTPEVHEDAVDTAHPLEHGASEEGSAGQSDQ